MNDFGVVGLHVYGCLRRLNENSEMLWLCSLIQGRMLRGFRAAGVIILNFRALVQDHGSVVAVSHDVH